MSADEIFKLLTDESRSGAPEPTLLPWLTRRVARSGLPAAAAAAAGAISAASNRWPVIADATAAIIAERERDPGRLAMMLDLLPPVAAHLGIEAAATIDWAEVGDDAVCYALLGGLPPALFRRARRKRAITRPTWRMIMTVPSLPALADIGALDWLATAALDERAATDQDAVYLLPFRSGPQRLWQAIEAIEAAVGEGSHWYAAALLTRAAPYLDPGSQRRLHETIADMPVFWSSRLARLADGQVPSWASDEDELAASHPAIPTLDELASGVDPNQLATIASLLIERTARSHGLGQPWEYGVDWLEGASEPPSAAVAQDFGLEEDRLRALEADAPPPARHLNAYVAAAGQDEPVPSAPLELGADYVLRCNIGVASRYSLVQGEASAFPDDLLPALQLRIVLFLDGRKPEIEPVELPATGDSAWVELPLPRVTEPAVLRGDVAVYYGAAIVLMYGLVLPFGGDGASGPEAVPRYRLSRSLADLTKVEGRSMSLAVHGPASAPAIYVNDLTFAPTEFRYDPSEIEKGRFPVLTAFYDAHFSVQVIDGEKGEVSRFSPRPGLPFAKSAAELDRDLRMLARDGSQVFEYLFSNPDHQARLRRMFRTEAAAHDQSPVLQVVALGDQPAPVPWAALYDLPLGSDISKYEPCPSIAEFGPGGSAGTPPANCPYEKAHQNDDRWKKNQLCPWGFWGLSAIIEHPPSIQARDLETQVRPVAGPPAILVGYDTGLDGKLCKRHLGELKKTHGSNLLAPYADGTEKLEEQLGGETMDVVYLYCHIIDDPTQPDLRVPAIQFGDGRVTRQDISLWRASSEFWPDPHWPDRHPLVVLNGCGSAEKGPGSIASLVGAFVESAGASGVIGTEIAIEQGLGGWAMELFLSALRNWPVGEALRSTRWEMLRGGNLIGLAYTPYCLAGLIMSPHRGE